MTVYEEVYSGNYSNITEDPTLSLIALSDKQLFLLEGRTEHSDIKEFVLNNTELKVELKALEDKIWECVALGGHLLFAIQCTEHRADLHKKNSFFTKVNMKKSGDVSRGTFS